MSNGRRRHGIAEVGNQLGHLVKEVGGPVNFDRNGPASKRDFVLDLKAPTDEVVLANEQPKQGQALHLVKHGFASVNSYITKGATQTDLNRTARSPHPPEGVKIGEVKNEESEVSDVDVPVYSYEKEMRNKNCDSLCNYTKGGE